MNIFEQASRASLTFSSARGVLSTDELWSLPLQAKSGFDLDNLAKGVSRELKAMDEESFVETNTNPAKGLASLRLEILKHVIASKQEENLARKNAAANAEMRERLLGALADKQEDELKNLSKEEILAQLAKL